MTNFRNQLLSRVEAKKTQIYQNSQSQFDKEHLDFHHKVQHFIFTGQGDLQQLRGFISKNAPFFQPSSIQYEELDNFLIEHFCFLPSSFQEEPLFFVNPDMFKGCFEIFSQLVDTQQTPKDKKDVLQLCKDFTELYILAQFSDRVEDSEVSFLDILSYKKVNSFSFTSNFYFCVEAIGEFFKREKVQLSDQEKRKFNYAMALYLKTSWKHLQKENPLSKESLENIRETLSLYKINVLRNDTDNIKGFEGYIQKTLSKQSEFLIILEQSLLSHSISSKQKQKTIGPTTRAKNKI